MAPGVKRISAYRVRITLWTEPDDKRDPMVILDERLGMINTCTTIGKTFIELEHEFDKTTDMTYE